jgi:hypothetical protein
VSAYTFANDAVGALEMQRFREEAARWKPSGFNADSESRLAFLLYRQKQLVQAELKRRFPESHALMVPVTLPVMRFFVKELSKVFLNGCDMPLVSADGTPLPPDADEVKAWTKLQEDIGLSLKLKRLDRYATGLGISFLKWGHSVDGVTAHIVLPNLVEAVLDPAYPMDLDKAQLVAVELASAAGPAGGPTDASRRFEVWCARKGEELHAIVRGDGSVESKDETYPYLDDDGHAVVPLVPFAQHTEELGLFPLQGEGLHQFNLAVDVAITGLYEIAETQGWGELVLTVPEGATPPPKIARGPRKAVALRDGITATILNYNAPIDQLVAKLQTDLKLAAMLHSLSPGSVSIEARQAASGVALTIEMRPLIEERQDTVEAYAPAMRRVWKLARICWNAWARTTKAAQFKADTSARWQPGDISMPEDQTTLVNRLGLEKRQGWRSDAEAVSMLRGIPKDEAQKVVDEVAATTKQVEPSGAPPPFHPPSVLAGARAKLGTPPGGAAPPEGQAPGAGKDSPKVTVTTHTRTLPGG